MRNIAVIIILVAAAVTISFLYKKPEERVVVQSAYFDGTIMIAGRGIDFELADTPEKQYLGLSLRDTLEENQAMLFTFERADFPVFWMKDMRFPIDMIWLKGTQVVDITQNAVPEPGILEKDLKTYSPAKPADGVIEVKGGWVSRNGLKIGDLVEITRVVR